MARHALHEAADVAVSRPKRDGALGASPCGARGGFSTDPQSSTRRRDRSASRFRARRITRPAAPTRGPTSPSNRDGRRLADSRAISLSRNSGARWVDPARPPNDCETGSNIRRDRARGREPPRAAMADRDSEAAPRVIAADPPVPVGRRRSPPPGFRGLARAFPPRLAAAPRGHAPPSSRAENHPPWAARNPPRGK